MPILTVSGKLQTRTIVLSRHKNKMFKKKHRLMKGVPKKNIRNKYMTEQKAKYIIDREIGSKLQKMFVGSKIS